MNTLANILAGVQGNPYATSPGISNLLMQDQLAQQMGPAQLGQGIALSPTVGQPSSVAGQAMTPNAAMGSIPAMQGLGSSGAAALPMAATGTV